MNAMKAQQVMSGTHGEVWINSQYMAECTEFKATLEFEIEEVRMAKSSFPGHKTVGAKGSGSVKLSHVSSFFVDLLADNAKKGKTTVCTIVAKLDDPDALGAERVALREVVFKKSPLLSFTSKKVTEDDIDFVFSDFDMLDKVETK